MNRRGFLKLSGAAVAAPVIAPLAARVAAAIPGVAEIVSIKGDHDLIMFGDISTELGGNLARTRAGVAASVLWPGVKEWFDNAYSDEVNLSALNSLFDDPRA